MKKGKLTLEDLKLESFLTELDNSKLVKVQGGNGAYGGNTEDGSCIDDCNPTEEPTDVSACCTTNEPSLDTCGIDCTETTGEEPTDVSACCTTEEPTPTMDSCEINCN